MDRPAPRVELFTRLIRYAMAYRWQFVAAIACMFIYGLAKTSVAWITKETVQRGLSAPVDPRSPAAPIVSAIPVAPAVPDLPAGHGNALDRVLHSSDPLFVILFVGIGLGLVGLTLFLSGYGAQYYAGYLTQRTLIDIRCQICERLLGMSISFFNDRRNGDLISRMTNDVFVINVVLRLLFGSVIKESIMLLTCVGAMFYINWRLTLTVLLIAPLLALLIRRLNRRVHRASLANLGSYSELTNEMSQIFSGIRVVKVFHMEKREVEEFRAISDRLFDAQMEITKANAAGRAFTAGLSHAALGVAACVGLVLLYQKHMDGPSLAAFLTLVATIYGPLKTISKAWNDVYEAIAALQRIFELIDARPEVEDSPQAVSLPEQHTGVRFCNVSFAYDGEAVLRNVSFDVRAGEIVAIVGQSGAGKSTLLDLIARFYDPQEGTVRVDGVDLRLVRKGSLIDKLAVVTQQTFLFNTTLGENIRYARPEATDEEVREAARLAQIDEFIQTLPEGYQAVVGEQGVKLSGGQRQRISLARAFLKRSQVLILDEATSELDSATEAKIHESLRRFGRGRTIFMVAHRLSSIQGADRIIVLESGRVAEVGTHAELLQRDGPYRRLYTLQMEGGGMRRESSASEAAASRAEPRFANP